MRITLIAGARPNFIKIAPIIHALSKGSTHEYRLVHTGQHYDKNLSESFFSDLNIPTPDVNLNVGSGSQAEQTAKIMIAFEKDLIDNPADYVLVVGDVNSTLACSIVAKKLHVKVIHVEAGLRSGDLEMPEEINRMVVDSICDVFFTTTPEATEILSSEGKLKNQIHFVGNVMIDSLIANQSKFIKPSIEEILNKKYFALTLHRPSNVDNTDKLMKLLTEIGNSLGDDAMAVFPVHPRTRNRLSELELPTQIKMIDAMRYLEVMQLIQHATGVITDSGGIQEESTYLGVPCITLRTNTERPETVTIGTNKIIGDDMELLQSSISQIMCGEWKNGSIPEKWDGRAAERIVNVLNNLA